jgi:hypothetical protein
MITLLNIGPARSGTTSFYNAFANHPNFRVGSDKEPLHEGYYLYKSIEYLNHWNYNNINRSDNTVLLDASPRLVYLEDSKLIKNFLKFGIDRYRHICLIRNPLSYYRTRFFINYLVNIVIGVKFGDKSNNNKINWNVDYSKIDLDHAKKGLDFNESDNEWRSFDHLSYTRYLRNVSRIFGKDEMFILPIEFFDEYKVKVEEFLRIEPIRFNLLRENKSFNVIENISQDPDHTIKLYQLYALIKESVENSSILKNLVKEQLKMIDSIYSSSLYMHYYG